MHRCGTHLDDHVNRKLLPRLPTLFDPETFPPPARFQRALTLSRADCGSPLVILRCSSRCRLDQISDRPKTLFNPCGHCGSHLQTAVRPNEIVVSEVKG